MLEQTAEKRLIILDPSLKNMGGHFYEYDAAIAAAASRRGMWTSVYAHKSCDATLALPGGEIHPWFSREWTKTGGRAKAFVRIFLNGLPTALHIPLAKLVRQARAMAKRSPRKAVTSRTAQVSAAAEIFRQETAAALSHAGCRKNDIIFLPTIRTSELFALWQAVQGVAGLSSLQFHIVLRRDAVEMDLPEDGAPGVSSLFRELSDTPAGRALNFYCDTQQLCDDYAQLASHQTKFRLLPIPFPGTDPDAAALAKWSAGPATKLVYLGGARTEKGFHLLSSAEALLRKKCPKKLLWRLQAPMNDAMEEPEVTATRRALHSVRDGSVELVERNLSPAEFQSLLLSADIVLLPYLPEFYRARSSGILVQVLAAGKPVIVPSGTWLSSQANGLGAVEFATPADFPEAIIEAVDRIAALTAEAQDRAPSYGAFHNADALLSMLATVAPPLDESVIRPG